MIKTHFLPPPPPRGTSLAGGEGGREEVRKEWVGTGRARGHRSEVMGHVADHGNRVWSGVGVEGRRRG